MINDVAPLPGYAEPFGLLCAVLLDATQDWRWEVPQELGPEVTTWRARPDGPSVGAIVLHMIGAEIFWFEHVALGREISASDRAELLSDEIDVDSCTWPSPPSEPLSWYFALHDRYRARTLEAVKAWPSAETQILLHGRPRSLRWILGHVIQHEAYHGGQIVMLHDLWNNRASG